MIIDPSRRIPRTALMPTAQSDYLRATQLSKYNVDALVSLGASRPQAEGHWTYTFRSPEDVFPARCAMRVDSVSHVVQAYVARLKSPPGATHMCDGSRMVHMMRCGSIEFCGDVLYSFKKPVAHAIHLNAEEVVILHLWAWLRKAQRDAINQVATIVRWHNERVADGRVTAPHNAAISVRAMPLITNLYNAASVHELAGNVCSAAEHAIERAGLMAEAAAVNHDTALAHHRRLLGHDLRTLRETWRLLSWAMDYREELQYKMQFVDAFGLPPKTIAAVQLASALANDTPPPLLEDTPGHEIQTTRTKLLHAIAAHALEA